MRPAPLRSARSRPPLGQHFLIDANAIARIVAALAPRHGETLVEIGPGRGALTAPLIAQAGRIAAIELDHRLGDRLTRQFDSAELILIQGSVLDVDWGGIAAALDHAPSSPLVVAGNLPYAVSKPIVMKLIAERHRLERAVLMFQREVARRLVAQPGGAEYGPLSVLCRAAFELELLFDLPPRAFKPPPRVVSSVVRLRPRRDDPLSDERERRLRACLRAAFARRRRTLRNNLREALTDEKDVDRLLDATEIDGLRRAETLDLVEFDRLAALWPLV
jgi:16S rRNA (adenine1518-N6/adenine1519-N6)-dimethyltransferase